MFSKRRIAQLSFFFLRRSFFAVGFAVAASRPRCSVAAQAARRLQNEVDRTNILAPGLFDLASAAALAPSSRLHPRNAFDDWPNGKSYPVTAAQLLPILTGFLAPIHFFKLAKNRDED